MGEDSSTPATTDANHTVAVNIEEAGVKPLQKVDITYFGIYLGPSLSNPGESAQVNPSTGVVDPADWPQVLENQVKLNYNFTDHFFVGPVINFNFYTGQTNTSTMRDSGVRIGAKNLLKTGGFSMKADVRALAATTPGDQSAHAGILWENLISLKYDVPHTKWTAGVLSFTKYHTYTDNGISPKTGLGRGDWELYLAPNANWQFSRKVAATMFVDFYPLHKIGAAGDWTTAQPADLNPGINWDITDNFSVNPGIVFYPTNPTWAATSTILYISGKLL